MEGRSTVEDRRLRNSYHRVCYVMARCCRCLVSSSTREQACLTLRTGCFISSGRTHGTSLATNSRTRTSSSLPRSTFCTSTVKVIQHFSAFLSHTHTQITKQCKQYRKIQYSKLRHAANSGWRRGVVVSGVRRMNEVNARRARLVPGWVTVFGRVYHLGM